MRDSGLRRRERRGGRSGFTLIEMLITIGIFMLLTGLLIPYSRKGERQILLFREQALVHGALIYARNLAIEKFQVGGQPVCGWGVHFDRAANRYAVFRDNPHPLFGCDRSNKIWDSPADELVSFHVDAASAARDPASVRVRFGVFEPTIITNAFDILFVAPEQFVFLNGCSPSPPGIPNGVCTLSPAPDTVRIVLETSDGAFTKAIEMNKAGQINLEE